MIRRSHKKSRQGCAQCKRSHKKCDESRPACVNCTTAKQQCSYTRNDSSRSPNERDFILSTGPEQSSRARTPLLNGISQTTNSSPRLATPQTSPTPPITEPHINFLHLVLFHNALGSELTYFADDSIRERWTGLFIKYSFAYPYLMYETLSFSAFHLSLHHPDPSKRPIYHSESTLLQAHALSLFNTSVPSVSDENLLPAFIFSAAIGLHVFCSTFHPPSPDLSTFFSHLIQSMRLSRGVRSIFGDNWEAAWEKIQKSEINIILSDNSIINPPDEMSHAFTALHTTFSHSHTLSAFESRIYCEAIDILIYLYNSRPLEGTLDHPPNSRMVTGWPISVSVEYTDLLEERKPEALVVLAYFSVLLHSRRAFWPVGRAGKFLFGAVEEMLGREWREWLVVPRRFVMGE